MIKFDNPSYETAIIGVTATTPRRLVYSYESMIDYLMEHDSMTEEEAEEFIDYNTLNAYIENGPIVIITEPEYVEAIMENPDD